MSRAAVYDAILAADLGAYDFDSSNVLVNYDGEQRPSDKMFIVLRWESPEVIMRGDDSTVRRGPRNLVVWVHMYKEFSTDFVRIDDVINKLDIALSDIINVAGADGESVTLIEPSGSSRDLRDDGYETFCRSTSYRVLSRKT